MPVLSPVCSTLISIITCGLQLFVGMLTGDHERTALAIAKMVGIIGNDYSDDSITVCMRSIPGFIGLTPSFLDRTKV